MAVDCKDAVFARGSFRLSAGVSLPKGASLALIGPSGAGKSLFLGGLAGFDSPLSGSVALDGRDMSGVPPQDRPVTLMFQDHNLFPHLTVLQNVGLGIDPGLRLDKQHVAQIEEALDAVELGGLSGRYPKALSGGQQSRVALARALIRERPVLLLDEPFSALGPGLRREMLALVERIRTEQGATLIFVTHAPDEARSADFTSLVDGGQVGDPVATEALFADPPEALRRYL